MFLESSQTFLNFVKYIIDQPELSNSKAMIIRHVRNQSRICGKGVGLSLFPSDSLESQSNEFFEIAHIGPYYGVENDCRKFQSNRMKSF